MRAEVVAIGNSRGIRIPKPILEQCRIRTAVDLAVRNGRIILEPIPQLARQPRQGWAKAFARMRRHRDDRLLLPPAVDCSEDDWSW